jgi:phosphoribosylglycinamide formyltransferase-1
MRVAVLASGEGTNLQALLEKADGREGIEIAAVASDKPQARALERARRAGIETAVFELDEFGDRLARDRAMSSWLRSRSVDLVVLAGYMQLLSEEFLSLFPGRIINVHPALLPAFPGLRAIEQALDYGVKVFGVTVHFVDQGVDTGPVILQRAVEVPDARSAEEVLDRLHPIEHELLPEAVRLIGRGAVRIDPERPRRVIVER